MCNNLVGCGVTGIIIMTWPSISREKRRKADSPLPGQKAPRTRRRKGRREKL